MSDTPTGDHYEAVARRLAARACDRRRAELEDELAEREALIEFNRQREKGKKVKEKAEEGS